jgi:hypothetical protein
LRQPVKSFSAHWELAATNIEISTKSSFKLFEVVGQEITTKYSRTWTDTETFTQTVNITAPPHTQMTVTAVTPVYRVSGTLTARTENTTFVINNATFDTPNKHPKDPTQVPRFDVTPSSNLPKT